MNSALQHWWWRIDRITFSIIVSLMFLSLILIATASPVVSAKIGVTAHFFTRKHFMHVIAALIIMCVISIMHPKRLNMLMCAGFVVCLFLLVVVLFKSGQIKGASRWVSFMGLTIQPSEYIKPFYIYIIALILAEKDKTDYPIYTICIAIHFALLVLLFLQPDVGMSVVLSCIFAYQLFLGGLNVLWLLLAGVFGSLLLLVAYLVYPHATYRINSFFNEVNYQVSKSLQAIENGGLFGRGLSNGEVKNYIPDCHSDFIFPVLIEECGAIAGLCLIVAMLCIFIRGSQYAMNARNLFCSIYASSAMMCYGLQSIFNIGIAMNLFPTKGLTLPLISYGGSSMFSYAILFGVYLNISKR